MNIWSTLGIAPTNNQSAIKTAFAEKSKACHPEEDAKGFMQLRQAYKAAMAIAQRNDVLEQAAQDAPPEEEHTPPEAQDAPPEEEDAPPEEEDAPPEEEDAPPEEEDAPPEEQDAPPEEQDAPFEEEHTPPEEQDAPTEVQDSPPEEEAPPEEPDAPLEEENAPPEEPEEAEKTAEPEKTEVPEPQEDALDFESILVPDFVIEARAQEDADVLIFEVAHIYDGRFSRNRRASWCRFFESDEFQAQKNNPYFARKFLSFIDQNNYFQTNFWVDFLRPQLKAWQYEWYSTPMWKEFESIINMRPPVVTGMRDFLVAVRVPFLTVTGVIVAFVCTWMLGNSTANADTTAQDEPVVTVQEVLGITEEEMVLIKLENSRINTVRTAILNAFSFDKVAQEAAALGISQQDYEQLAQVYAQTESWDDLNTALIEFCTIQSVIVAEKIIPAVRAEIIRGTVSEQGRMYLDCLDIYNSEYQFLKIVYQKAGEDALDAVLTSYKSIEDIVLVRSIDRYVAGDDDSI